MLSDSSVILVTFCKFPDISVISFSFRLLQISGDHPVQNTATQWMQTADKPMVKLDPTKRAVVEVETKKMYCQ